MEGRPLDPENDVALAQRAKDGDVDAYAELVRRHQPAAVRLAYVIGGNHGDAEDITQDAFVKAYHAISRYRSGAPFRPWVLRIVANEARNRRRSRGRRAHYELWVAEDRTAGGTALSPEAAVLATESRRALLAAVSHLQDRYRDVVVCRYFAGLSEAETAAVLDIPPGTVKSRLARAIDRLRGEFDE